MKNIVYVSSAVRLLGDDQLVDILTSARENNAKRHVTGVLLYSEGAFIQVLEGEDDDVDDIMAKIQKDVRHKNIITLIDERISQKSFPEWHMAFSTPKADKLKDVLGFLQSLEGLHANRNTGAAASTIKTFIESNRLVVTY